MTTAQIATSATARRRAAGGVVSLVGAVLLAVPAYDVWDDVTDLGWSVTTTVAENAVLFALALGLVAGGVWVGTRDWEPTHAATVSRWTVGGALAVGGLLGLVVAIQLRVMSELKHTVLVLDGALLGASLAFAAGVQRARHRRAATDLAESEARYRSLVEDAFDAVDAGAVVVDADGTVVWANGTAAAYLGTERDALVGADRLDALDTSVFEDGDAVRERLAAALDGEGATAFECHVVGGDGRAERWLDCRTEPIEEGLYAGGRIEHYVDVTSRKRLADLRRQRERLVLTNRLLRHDLRNDLNVVQARSETIRPAVADDPDAARDLDLLQARTAEMAERIESIRALVDAVVAEGDRDLDAVPIRDAVSPVVERVAAAAPGATVETGSIPDVRVLADDLLEEVLENVVRNAVQHAGDAPTVTVSAERTTHDGEAALRLVVADDGPGIPDDVRARVDRGVTGGDRDRGVGLPLAAELASLYGGRLDVEDRDGGAAVAVTLRTAGE